MHNNDISTTQHKSYDRRWKLEDKIMFNLDYNLLEL